VKPGGAPGRIFRQPWTSSGSGATMIEDIFPGMDYGYDYWGDHAILGGS
jgi:hypothetical protein